LSPASSPGAFDPVPGGGPDVVVAGAAAGAVLVWRFTTPLRCASSAPLGGGLGERHWVLNAQVPPDYGRLDPAAHLGELARASALAGPGVGMMTAVDVRRWWSAVDGGVDPHATVGVTHPTWAAAAGEGGTAEADAAEVPAPGTINVVACLPEPLSDAALVNAVATLAEAKGQALWDAGIPATGTASDALCVACPTGGRVSAFGGPRSRWGARLARAVHRAVLDGCGPVPR